jgi:endonuclease/exonuclease/phosphatase family metal-dependent hydrolase
LTLFDRKYQEKEYKNTFMAKDFINVIQTFEEIPSLQTNVRKFKQKLQKRETSLLFGKLLQDIEFIKPTSRSEDKFENNSTLFFAPLLENNEAIEKYLHLQKIALYGNSKEKIDEFLKDFDIKHEDFEENEKIILHCFKGKEIISWITKYLEVPEIYSIYLLEIYHKHGVLQSASETSLRDLENGYFRIQSKEVTQVLSPMCKDSDSENEIFTQMIVKTIKKKRRKSSVGVFAEKSINRKTGVIEFNPSALPSSENHVKELSIVICTWNCAEGISEDIGPWIKKQDADIFVIGLQEVDMSMAAMVKEQTQAYHDWNEHFEKVFDQEEYQKIVSIQLVGLYHIIFIKKEYSGYLFNLKYSKVSLGQLGMGNKGCIAYRFELLNNTFCFINAHFAAHQKKVDERNQNFYDIMTEDLFEEPKKMSPFSQDFLFFFGDLNYRLDMTYEKAISLISKNDLKSLLSNDQLSIQMKEKKVFQGFYEESITFKPSYKYDKSTNDFDTSEKKRIPSYCDRILIKSDKSHYSVGYYVMNTEEWSSDHRPILAKYKIYLQ